MERKMELCIIIHVFILCVFNGVSAAPMPCGDFRFANYYGDHMVLQGAPGTATVWGYTPNVGDQITVDIDQSSVVATSELGEENLAVWHAELGPFEGGPFTVVATSDGCSITLDNVLFGDVWMCSGQSNMEFEMWRLDESEEELAEVVNYPEIRSLKTGKVRSDDPLWEPESVTKIWEVSTPENMEDFSAVCWYFAKNVYNRVQRPMGLIDSTWGGTRIEAWSSPDAIYECFGDEGSPGFPGQVNEENVLWNAMIHPYLRMTIFGVTWYQGEANQRFPEEYLCSLPAMIADWRQKWSDSSATTTQFPFGQVQLAPDKDELESDKYTDLRWTQTIGYGYCPNEILQDVFMAVAIDLPDFESPYLTIHPRPKRQIGERLALGAFPIAYDIHDMGIFKGPLPTSIENEGSHFVVTYDSGNADLNIRENPRNIGFQLCCSDSTCMTNSTYWTHSEIMGSGQSNVRIENTCDGDVMGLRYVWGESPCDLESCFVYSVENDLPAPPYVYKGDLSGQIVML